MYLNVQVCKVVTFCVVSMSGRDLEPGREGGTWLAASTNGKFGALLNVAGGKAPGLKDRGRVCATCSLLHVFVNKGCILDQTSQNLVQVYDCFSAEASLHVVQCAYNEFPLRYMYMYTI